MSTYMDCGWDEKTEVHIGGLPVQQVEAVYRAAAEYLGGLNLDPRLALSEDGRALVDGLEAIRLELERSKPFLAR